MSISKLTLGTLALTVSLVAPAIAAPTQHAAPRPAAAPRGKEAGARYVGSHVVPHPSQPVHPVNNPPHQVIYHNSVTNKDESHPVIIDHRPAHIVAHDPRVRVVVRGYHPVHNWGHFHYAAGGWFHVWGITAWDNVGTVTCEASNEATGEMYPVTMDRDKIGWSDDAVNAILDQALDDCVAESGTATCVPASPSCSFQNY